MEFWVLLDSIAFLGSNTPCTKPLAPVAFVVPSCEACGNESISIGSGHMAGKYCEDSSVSVTAPGDHKVVAYNTAKTSDNKIHDDDVARQFGFSGGLVPGVDVYAYMTHPAVACWGQDWLERGWMSVRLQKPVYEGAEVVVRADLAAEGEIDIVAESGGQSCAVATAKLPAKSPAGPRDQFPRLPLPHAKPPAGPESLPADLVLGTYERCLTASEAPKLLADVREDLPIYAEAGLVHPGYLLRMANWILRENVILGPWIHVSSELQNFDVAEIDAPLSARGRVISNFERKGHKFVELDVLVLQEDEKPLLRIKHTAIYQPRHAAA